MNKTNISKYMQNKIIKEQENKCARKPYSRIDGLQNYHCLLWKKTRSKGVFIDKNYVFYKNDDNIIVALCNNCSKVLENRIKKSISDPISDSNSDSNSDSEDVTIKRKKSNDIFRYTTKDRTQNVNINISPTQNIYISTTQNTYIPRTVPKQTTTRMYQNAYVPMTVPDSSEKSFGRFADTVPEQTTTRMYQNTHIPRQSLNKQECLKTPMFQGQQTTTKYRVIFYPGYVPGKVYIRNGPSNIFEIIGIAYYGDIIDVIQIVENNEWLMFNFEKNKIGYIKQTYDNQTIVEKVIDEQINTTIKNENEEQNICCICYNKLEYIHALIPCGHTSTCIQCINKIDKCAICTKKITGNLRIYH
jgi:hypothetical protein